MNKRKKKKHNNSPSSYLELHNSIRKNWNGINPVSRKVESKKYKKPKYKKVEDWE